MGYDIHITRKENWFDEDDSNEIKLSEWLAYVKADNEMRLDNHSEAETDAGDKVRYESTGLAVWTAYSKNGHGGNYAWFDFRGGYVTVKNPDEEIKNKMIEIAGQLNAKVQGDEGELYDTKNIGYDTKEMTKEKRPWWKMWS